MKKSLVISTAFTALLGVFVWFSFFQSKAVANKPVPQNLYGQITPFKLPDVPLQTQHQDKSDWLALSDKPLFITTGFTNCPHVCPMTMAFYQQLKGSVGDKANLALITIDPNNDTQEVLNEYLSRYGENFIGIRVDEQQHLDQILLSLKQSYTLSKHSEYLEHQSYIYLLHPKLEGLLVYTDSSPDPKQISNDLETLGNL